MRGISCADVSIFPTTDALPAEAVRLLGAKTGLFNILPWWQVVEKHAVPHGGSSGFVSVRFNGRLAAVVPVLRAGRQLSSLTTAYTCEYTPTFADGLDEAQRRAAAAAFAAYVRSSGLVRLDALPAEWEGLRDWEAGCRQGGLVPMRFDHFGNWFEVVEGQGWSTYLGQRPGALRETIRRRLRRAEALESARFMLFERPEDMGPATEAYESVYRRSWKEAEPFPQFNVALMRAMAEIGALRLGVWSFGDIPIATQSWVVRDGVAIVLKLAHDEAYKAQSPGTVLTAFMLRHLLDREGVRQIDFGRGDDPYKQGWAMQRRQRIGLLLANPWHPLGIAALGRHSAGRIWSDIRLRLRGRDKQGAG